MKCAVDVGALYPALRRACEVVAQKTQIPILGNVLIQTAEAAISVTSTDLDGWFVERVTAAVDAAGSATVPARMLHGIARKLPADRQLTMDLDIRRRSCSAAAARGSSLRRCPPTISRRRNSTVRRTASRSPRPICAV